MYVEAHADAGFHSPYYNLPSLPSEQPDHLLAKYQPARIHLSSRDQRVTSSNLIMHANVF